MSNAETLNLGTTISAMVAARMTPEFVEKQVESRVDKLIVEAVDSALRSYSETGKLIEKAVQDALRVERLDIPAYGEMVSKMLAVQIERVVAPLVSERLANDMEELLKIAPKTIKLSEIAAEMRKRHEGEAHGDVITCHVEETEYGSWWVYLDEDEHLDRVKPSWGGRDYKSADIRLLIGKDGLISSATINGRDVKDAKHFSTSYGLDQRIRAYFACGTIIEIDEDNVATSVGDY